MVVSGRLDGCFIEDDGEFIIFCRFVEFIILLY